MPIDAYKRKLKYRKEPPTEAGWYWCKRFKKDYGDIGYYHFPIDGSKTLCIESDIGHGIVLNPEKYWWAGPIHHPIK